MCHVVQCAVLHVYITKYKTKPCVGPNQWALLQILSSQFEEVYHPGYLIASLFIPPANEVGGGGGIFRLRGYRNHPVCLSVCLSVCSSVQSKLNIDYYFLTDWDKAFILHLRIPCDKTFLSVPKMLTLWPWPWLLTYFSKYLTLAITFKPKEVGLSYYICVFLLTRPFCWYQQFWPCDLDLDFWPTFQKT